MPPALDFRRVAAALAGQDIGGQIVYHEEIGSTNDEARRLATEGWPHGTVVVADSQTAGRGRRGAEWFATPRKCLLFSVILRPSLPPTLWSRLTHVAALAVAEALEKLPGPQPLQPAVKWPNDIYLSGKKVAGLLLESAFTAGQEPFCILGIGLNVSLKVEDLLPELRPIATSIGIELGDPHLPREQVLQEMLRSLARLLPQASANFPALLHRLQERSWLKDKTVIAEVNGTLIQGQAIAMNEDGALLLRLPDGSTHTLTTVDRIRPIQ